MSLERSQEFFSVHWQARSKLKVLPIVPLRSGLFWAITQSEVVIPYQRFGTTYWSNLQGPRNQFRKILLRIFHVGPLITCEFSENPSVLNGVPETLPL
jgi:hypothetical protein